MAELLKNPPFYEIQTINLTQISYPRFKKNQKKKRWVHHIYAIYQDIDV